MDGQTYVVAKFMPHDLLAASFKENYAEFLKLEGSKKRNARTKPSQHFRNLVGEVREQAYKNFNNCTSFPKASFGAIKQN